jgi:predicted nucleic acid-binding Zn ribbon protein
VTDEQRRLILQEWRLLPEPPPTREAKSVGSLVEGQMARLGLGERLLEDQMAAAWQDIVGPANAALSKPVSIRKGEVVVAVAQPALKYTFERFHAEEILRRLQERFGSRSVTAVRFRIGS